jgi:hypothetical protein
MGIQTKKKLYSVTGTASWKRKHLIKTREVRMEVGLSQQEEPCILTPERIQ